MENTDGLTEEARAIAARTGIVRGWRQGYPEHLQVFVFGCNRHDFYCAQSATEAELHTAKFPIEDAIEKRTRWAFEKGRPSCPHMAAYDKAVGDPAFREEVGRAAIEAKLTRSL